jgi:hypothetical protein
MNERIKELAEQCWDKRPEGQLHFDNEKFADLIVWECMKICEYVMKKDNSALACWSGIKRTFRS